MGHQGICPWPPSRLPSGSSPVLISESSTHEARIHIFWGLQRAGNHIRTLATTRGELPSPGGLLVSTSSLCLTRWDLGSPPWLESTAFLLFLAFPHVPAPPAPASYPASHVPVLWSTHGAAPSTGHLLCPGSWGPLPVSGLNRALFPPSRIFPVGPSHELSSFASVRPRKGFRESGVGRQTPVAGGGSPETTV